MDGYLDESDARAGASAPKRYGDEDDGPVGGAFSKKAGGKVSRGGGFGTSSSSASAQVGEKRGRQRYHEVMADGDGAEGDSGDHHHGGKKPHREASGDADRERDSSRDHRDRSASGAPPKEKRRKLLKEKPRELSVGRYLRGADDKGKVTEGTSDKKLKTKLKRQDKKYREAAMEAARAELLLTEEAG
jgi:hypothetical protein